MSLVATEPLVAIASSGDSVVVVLGALVVVVEVVVDEVVVAVVVVGITAGAGRVVVVGGRGVVVVVVVVLVGRRGLRILVEFDEAEVLLLDAIGSSGGGVVVRLVGLYVCSWLAISSEASWSAGSWVNTFDKAL